MAADWTILSRYAVDYCTDTGLVKSSNLLDYYESISVQAPLSYYLSILDGMDSVFLPYLRLDDNNPDSILKERRGQLKQDLVLTRFLLVLQVVYEVQHQKREHLKSYLNKIEQCSLYLQALEHKDVDVHAIKNRTQPSINCLEFALGLERSRDIWHLQSDSKTKLITNAMGAVNGKRLYWVWGSSLLKSVLSVIPENFYNIQQADTVVSIPDPYTSCMSWLLYFSRFAINLSLLLKHIVPWALSEEEKKIPWVERFQAQWAQRKFTLLNDSLWGVANLLGAIWLTGRSILGTAGDALTTLLLGFDVAVSLWAFAEQRNDYRAEIKQYKKEIDCLNKKINVETNSDIVQQLKLYLGSLQKAKSCAEKNWRLNQYSLYNEMAYSIGLMLAFIVFTTPFMPIPAAAATFINLAGAMLCFVFTVINNAVREGGALYKTRLEIKETRAAFNEQIGMFKELPRNKPGLQDYEKKYLFLEIKKRYILLHYQEQLALYQTLVLLRSILIETLIPTILFTSLVFFPLSIALSALGSILALAIASHYLLEGQKPDEKIKKLSSFSEQEYINFTTSVKDKGTPASEYGRFFKKQATAIQLPELKCKNETLGPVTQRYNYCL